MFKKFLLKSKRVFGNALKSQKNKRHSLVGAGNLWKMKQDFQIKFLKEHGLKTTDIFLDIGCGTLRGGIPIIDYLDTNNYYGVEVRGAVLDEGRKELQNCKLEHKNPTLLSFHRFNDLQIHTKFDVVFAFSVLIHMSDDIVDNCFQFVSEHLSHTGVFYCNVNIGKYKDGYWQGFPVVFRSFEFYNNKILKYGMSLESMGTLYNLGHISGKDSDKQQIMLKISKL